MGVTYKLKDEVVHFIISQRQDNPLASCRQLADLASQKFGLNLSKSSVHDVLKQSGIMTPRGRKPKDKFEIPQEKKQQIQNSLSQIKLIPEIKLEPLTQAVDGAGSIFLKAARWELGIFTHEELRPIDVVYYLTYAKGAIVNLVGGKQILIKMSLPVERCIREIVDGLINNIRPFIVDDVSDADLFKEVMDFNTDLKMVNIVIVDSKDNIICNIIDIMDFKRKYLLNKRLFVENRVDLDKNRAKSLFFSGGISDHVFDEILAIKGKSVLTNERIDISLSIHKNFSEINLLKQGIERLNAMFIRDEEGRLLKLFLED